MDVSPRDHRECPRKFLAELPHFFSHEVKSGGGSDSRISLVAPAIRALIAIGDSCPHACSAPPPIGGAAPKPWWTLQRVDSTCLVTACSTWAFRSLPWHCVTPATSCMGTATTAVAVEARPSPQLALATAARAVRARACAGEATRCELHGPGRRRPAGCPAWIGRVWVRFAGLRGRGAASATRERAAHHSHRQRTAHS